jgi:hypothetical protein
MRSTIILSRFSAAAFAAFLAALPLVLPAPAFSSTEVSAPAEDAKSITVESRIKAATVYPDRAVVSRAGKIRVNAGVTELVFADLPQGLADESVQVSARGTTAASLLDIAVRMRFETIEPDARLRAAAEKIVELRRRERALNDQGGIVGSQRTLLANVEQAYLAPVAASSEANMPWRLSLDDYAKFLGFSAEQRERIEKDARKLDDARAALAEEFAVAEKQFAELRGEQPGGKATKRVTVRLATPGAGELEVMLGYALPGASWTPAYDARLRSADRQVQLDAFGLVRNRTGEDWHDVELTLSTARPGLGGAAPEIEAWLVDAPEWAKGSSSSSSFFGFSKKPKRPDPSSTVIGQEGTLLPGSAEAFGSADNDVVLSASALLARSAPAAPRELEANYLLAKAETVATSASFRIETPVTLASDNTPQRVPLGATSFAAELSYEAAPKRQEAAYLAAKVKNSGELPFLGGSLNAFLDETFVASSALETTMPGETFALHLGADEAISVRRKVRSRFTEDTGLASRGRRTSYDILITVVNNKRTAERVTVRDVVPVAGDEKIVVKLLTPGEREFMKPEDAAALPEKAGVVRDAEGRIAWRLDLKPGEKRELPLKFSIEHPTELPVTGVE